MSEPKKPKPSQPAYLPRTWKAAPEPEPEVSGKLKDNDLAPGKAAKVKDATGKPTKKTNKKPDAEPTGKEGASKLEETPLLDTHEGRQRVRIIVGSVVSLAGLVAIIALVRAFQPSSSPVDPNADRNQTKTAVDPKESLEREAAALVENAKQSDKLGRFDTAIKLLSKVTRNYEETQAAKEATAALDRDRRNRPLFAVDDLKNPSGPIPPRQSVADLEGKGATPPSAITTGPAPVALTPPSPVKPPEIVARPLPNGFRAETSAPIHPSCWPMRITCDRDKAVMILIPAGEFLMGREDGESTERPSHRVKLSAFYIDEHEVTNRQYQVYLKESGRVPDDLPPERLDFPAVSLTAREAQAYCYWANRRLPSEAQWELAARSEDGRVSYGPIGEVAKASATTRTLEPVMSSPNDRSPLGGFDFAANAWEWTSDYYDSKYYYQAKDLSVDPRGPNESRIKPAQATVKGGSKLGFLTWREGVRIEARNPLIGFRGALPVEASANPPAGNSPATPGTNSSGGSIPF